MISASGTSFFTCKAAVIPANEAPSTTRRFPNGVPMSGVRAGRARATRGEDATRAAPTAPARKWRRSGRGSTVSRGLFAPPPSSTSVESVWLVGGHLQRLAEALASRVLHRRLQLSGASGREIKAKVRVLAGGNGRLTDQDWPAVEGDRDVGDGMSGDRRELDRMILKASVIGVRDRHPRPVGL